MTGEGVAYRRKKWGIKSSLERRNPRILLEAADLEKLEKDYLSLSQEAFSAKYRVSKTIWRPYLKELGVISKAEQRISSYPNLTAAQKSLIVGSLLGDGSVSQGNRFCEFHSRKQKLYLEEKARILAPYSTRLTPSTDEKGYILRTICHPCFEVFYNAFYTPGKEGKGIPLALINECWDDSVLAYWFFDDGHYDDTSELAWIGNNCPDKKELEAIVEYINNRYGWSWTIRKGSGVYVVAIPKEDRDAFFNVILKHSTPDVLYKIPEHLITAKNLDGVSFNGSIMVRPKLYRLASDDQKKAMESRIFSEYRRRGFPYFSPTLDRKRHLLKLFENAEIVVDGATIKHSSSGLKLCESFFPNMYNCNRKGYRSPCVLWEDDGFLIKLIKNRLKYAKLLSDSTMRTGIKLTKASVTNFKPIVARYLYRKYGRRGKVLDYSAGFGSRMLAAALEGCKYVGYDPCSLTVKNLCIFGDFLKDERRFSYDVKCQPFEKSELLGQYDFAFSCPPYFDFEVYGNDAGQSILSYPGRKSWIEKYWVPTVSKALRTLSYRGHFSACLSPYICFDMITTMFSVCSEHGFVLVDEYKIPFPDVIRKSDRYEIVFVFGRGTEYRESSFFPAPGAKPVENDHRSVFEKVTKNKTYHFSEEDFKKAEEFFRRGPSTSREVYREQGVYGVPVHVLERRYGSWNAFVRASGIEPGYVAHSPKEHIQDYFKACLEKGSVLSFMGYERETGNPCTRLKRLFNKGKPYHHLKQALFDCAVDPDKQKVFLGTMFSR